MRRRERIECGVGGGESEKKDEKEDEEEGKNRM